jgi:hypothetical protein
MNVDRKRIRDRAAKLKAMQDRGTEFESLRAGEILETMLEEHEWLQASMDGTDADGILQKFVDDWNEKQASALRRAQRRGGF